MNIQSFCGVLVGLALVNPCAAFLQNMPRAEAGPYNNFCASQRYETIGGKRTKICCNSQGFCTTRYGIYNK